jgi:VWFA-related protein
LLKFALVVCLMAVLQAPQAPPQFRASVDLMRIDVTVLDRNTRKPVRGLKAEDFEVRVNGDQQSIQAVAEVNSGARQASAGPAWQDTAARDVVTNDVTGARLLVIVMDDRGGGPWHRQSGKRVAHTIIDGLGPDDLAAVVFANKTDRSQDFTADRALLRAAVDSFDPLANPRFACPDFSGTVWKVRSFLSRLARYRRAIMLVTSRGVPEGRCETGWWWLRDAGLKDEDHEAASSASLESGSRLGQVPIYFFTTFGLTVSTNPAARSTGESAINLARRAGGRAIVENNAPETEVPAVLDELATHYTLAYVPTFPLDGKLRFADIKVLRPDVIVMPASGAFRTAREVNDGDARRTLAVKGGSGLSDAITAPLMSGTLPMRLTTTTIAVPGAREQAVAITVGLPAAVDAPARQEFALLLTVHDGEGRTELLRSQQTVTIPAATSPSDALAEVLLRVDLRAGRYNVRVAAEAAGGGPAGSAYAVVTVPDLSRESLSMSGLAIGRAEGRPVGGREALQSLLPFAPTTVRAFASTDRVGALVRVHQRAGRPAQAMTVTITILDAAGATVVTATRQVAAAEVTAGGVEHRYELPLASLPAGEYLLSIAAAVTGTRDQPTERHMRFSVTRPNR